VTRQFARRTLRRLLAAAGLARAADLARERKAAARLVAAERSRARRDAAVRLERLRARADTSHTRVLAEHAQVKSLVGLLRHYLIRLRRTEAELAGRAMADRRLKLEQLAIAIKVARRRGVSSEAAVRAAHQTSTTPDYTTAVARWRAGEVPADLRRVTLGHLDWSVPAGTSDALGRRIVDRGQLALDSLAIVRQFAVGGVMLDIGAGVGAASIPRVLLGDFSVAYAAEPEERDFLCLVGNTLDNALEGRVIPHRMAPTLDDWVRQLGLNSFDVRFVRVAMREWSLNVLDAAASLLKRRQIVWQIEMDSSMLEHGSARLDSFCQRVDAHFTHIKELGRYWTPPWRSAAEVGAVIGALAEARRPVNLLLFNMRRDLARRPKALL
jgi:precorrin-6B methylase 2